MERPHLVIVCGVPGSGKSTFAARAAERWGAVKFASETFAEELGPAARTASGDLSKQAIAHAYAAMGAAVTDALAKNRLTVAVGSFRSEELRNRFRAIARNVDAHVTTLRVVTSAKTAAERVCARRELGERGPNQEMIARIGAELDQADDVEIVLINNSSFQDFYQKVDAVMRLVTCASKNDVRIADVTRRLEQPDGGELSFAGDFAAAITDNRNN